MRLLEELDLLPNDTIAYWLSHTQRYLARALSGVLRAQCQALGKTYTVTPLHWLVLQLLGDEDGQSVGCLAQRLGLDAPAVTTAVTRIEANGLVERFHNLDDRRVVKVYLTLEGVDIARSLAPVVKEFHARIMPQEAQQAFISQLQQMITRISTLYPESGDKLDLS
jgi:DNA-binding MarR family transcriptional regulator